MSEISELKKREAIIEHCKALNKTGLNHGTSGNISIRHNDGMFISPTSLPYDLLVPESIESIFKPTKSDQSPDWDLVLY